MREVGWRIYASLTQRTGCRRRPRLGDEIMANRHDFIALVHDFMDVDREIIAAADGALR